MDNEDVAAAPDGQPRTASRQPRTASRQPRTASRRRRLLPPQHGAWAMLAVPYLAGVIAAGFRWLDLPLLGAWFGGYVLSYFVLQAVKTRRPQRVRTQVTTYAAVSVPLAALVVIARPSVLVYAPAYLALFAVNAWYAARRRERALLNDLASVVQACLVVFVVATVAATPPSAVAGVFLLCLAYFGGTTFYVKTMIRERDNPAYVRWSIGYHVLALGLAAWLSPWAAVLFAWLLVRAALLPRRRLAPRFVGLIEIANCALLLASVALL